jgi:hypothetical protein
MNIFVALVAVGILLFDTWDSTVIKKQLRDVSESQVVCDYFIMYHEGMTIDISESPPKGHAVCVLSADDMP